MKKTNVKPNTGNPPNNMEILQILYYIIKVKKTINNNTSNDSIFLINDVQTLEVKVKDFFKVHSDKLNEAIDKFNKSFEFLKKSNDSELYLLFFNYKILENIQIDEFIETLKRSPGVNNNFTKIWEKINSGYD